MVETLLTNMKHKYDQGVGQKSVLRSRIEGELKTYEQLGHTNFEPGELTHTWQTRVAVEPKRFINDDQSIDWEALQNFRQLQIFVSDIPAKEPNSLLGRLPGLLAKPIGGVKDLFREYMSRNSDKMMLRECLAVLKEHGYDDLLLKYPCHPAGNPDVFQHQGYSYTFRWFKHIYFLGLLHKFLGNKLADNFTSLDIGSSYGVFPGLLKWEYPRSHHILVDFPAQLILAYYYLNSCFPGAKIAGVKEVSREGSITAEFTDQYDFVLIPVSLYQDLACTNVSLFTNFTSLGEMRREWFDRYLESAPFLSAKYFFTSNRIQSAPSYDTDLTILDYPIWNPSKRIHFSISPVWSTLYLRRSHFLFTKVAASHHFEYIGEI